MMMSVIKYGAQFYLIFLFPIIGMLLGRYVAKKTTLIMMCTSFALFIPVLASYRYSIPLFDQLLALLFLSSAYSFLSEQISRPTAKTIIAIVFSAVLLFIMIIILFLKTWIGITTSEQSWEDGSYRVDNIKYHHKPMFGSASTVYSYRLIRYSLGGLFYQEIEAVKEKNIYACDINFPESKVVFNKCHETIKEVE